jgi:hypothetical protein
VPKEVLVKLNSALPLLSRPSGERLGPPPAVTILPVTLNWRVVCPLGSVNAEASVPLL